jgi:gluconate 2-dehydrogenase gamma chain
MLVTDFVAHACNKRKGEFCKETGVEASSKLNRRAFLQAALAAAAAGAGVACSTRNGTPWRFLTVDEARTLAAISDQIIPPDQDPGAGWAGVVNYMDRQLCGPFRNLQQTYRHGIAGVDQSSRLIHGKAFADLDAQQQTDVLHRLEDGQAPGAIWKQASSSEFLAYLVDHTMQGYYGDPRHGGNREGASWKMLGLPYPPIRGRLRYDLNRP